MSISRRAENWVRRYKRDPLRIMSQFSGAILFYVILSTRKIAPKNRSTRKKGSKNFDRWKNLQKRNISTKIERKTYWGKKKINLRRSIYDSNDRYMTFGLSMLYKPVPITEIITKKGITKITTLVSKRYVRWKLFRTHHFAN